MLIEQLTRTKRAFPHRLPKRKEQEMNFVTIKCSDYVWIYTCA